jgi:predicted PurR-regulated permease PerM
MSNQIPATRAKDRISTTWGDPFGAFAMRCLQGLIVITLAALVVVAGLALKTLVVSVLLAVILACAFSPLVRVLSKVLPRTLAALLTLVVVIGALGGLLTLVGFAVAGQVEKIGGAVSRSVAQVEAYLQGLGLPVDDASIQKALHAGQEYLTSSSFGSHALEGLSVAGEIGTGTILLLFVLFFLLRDGARIWAFLTQVFKGRAHARSERVGAAGALVLGSYARGTAFIAAIDAVIIGLALFIMHVPLALPLAVLVFITAFIPIIGAPIAGALAAGVALVFNGPVVAVIVIAVIVAVHLTESHLLQPFIMGHSVSLHPLAILLGLTAGTILGGIVGAILAVPATSVIWAAMKAWHDPLDDVVDEPAPMPLGTSELAPKRARRHRGIFGLLRRL